MKNQRSQRKKKKKKKLNPNPKNILLSVISQAQKPRIIWFHLYEKARIEKSIETENGLVVARGWKKRIGSDC